jgi:putative glutamine amidotransferase
VHKVTLTQGGMLEKLTGVSELQVNSLHSQGIDRLGKGLSVEAVADDGLVEAYRVENSPAFALAVQWHPEWRVMENPISQKLFQAFGNACRSRAQGPESHDLDHAVV